MQCVICREELQQQRLPVGSGMGAAPPASKVRSIDALVCVNEECILFHKNIEHQSRSQNLVLTQMATGPTGTGG